MRIRAGRSPHDVGRGPRLLPRWKGQAEAPTGGLDQCGGTQRLRGPIGRTLPFSHRRPVTACHVDRPPEGSPGCWGEGVG